jgi:hypothetical protein
MSNWNNTSSEKWFTDKLFDRIGEENNLYSQKSKEEKKQYWVWVITRVFHELENWEKIDISEYRETEPNIDLFLNDILYNIESYHWENREDIINNYFILDEQAKKTLEVQSNISNNSEQIKNTISSKTEKIEWIDISNEKLAEKIGDLFYDSLSSFIFSLWDKIDNKEISELLKEASNHIMNAWNICLPYVSDDFPEMKHTADIKWLDIDREELVKGISNLVNTELSDFLEKFSLKIEKDWEADKWRWRIKLANELFACADKLKISSDILK